MKATVTIELEVFELLCEYSRHFLIPQLIPQIKDGMKVTINKGVWHPDKSAYVEYEDTDVQPVTVVWEYKELKASKDFPSEEDYEVEAEAFTAEVIMGFAQATAKQIISQLGTNN